MSRPRCVYPGCLADATHRLFFWHTRQTWIIDRYRWQNKHYCRWHATVLTTLSNARGQSPDEVLVTMQEEKR